MAGLPYAELAARVMQPFVGDSLTPRRLRELCDAGLRPLRPRRGHPAGPARRAALAARAVPRPDAGVQGRRAAAARPAVRGVPRRAATSHLTIVGATSGDTGSAAIDAVAGRASVDIFMLHPKGRVSDVQRRQMTTVLAPNVHNIAIDGSFDDAQAMVKRMFGDPAMTGALPTSARSIRSTGRG